MVALRSAKILFCWGFFLQRWLLLVDSAIGVNWGTVSSHRLPPPVVVDLLKANKIGKVKLFDADPDALRALRGSGIEVMVGIPNELLGALASSAAASDLWVSQNVTRYMGKGGADIRYHSSNAFSRSVYLDLYASLIIISCINTIQRQGW